MADGAPVARDDTSGIADIEPGPSGGYLLLDDVGITLLDTSGNRTPVLVDDTPAPPDARLVPPTVSVDGDLSSCCSGTSTLAGIAVDETGRILTIDRTFGRLLRVGRDGTVERVLGPERTENACDIDCPRPSETFGPDGDQAAPVDDVLLTSVSGPSPLAFDPISGDLFVALGGDGTVRLNLRDR